MANTTLEDIVQRLDRLEKMMTEVNQKFSEIVGQMVLDVPKDRETAAALRGAEALKNSKREAHIAEEVLDKMFEKWGIPPNFNPGSIEELRESMRQHGIRAEDNEFSRAIIAEREK